MNHRLHNKMLGLIGFMGFLGFRYFQTGDVRELSFFAFFGFFAYFWVGRIASEIADELYVKNSRKAKATAYNLALFEFMALFLLVPFKVATKEIITVACSLFFASLIISYAIAFYYYERV